MIEIDNLHKVFNQGTSLENHAVRGVDLQVAKGEFLTLIGSNGSGKSTLLRLLSGEHLASEGSISITGEDVTAMPWHLRSKFLCQVFQDPLAGSCAQLTIEENLAVALMRTHRRGLAKSITRPRQERFRERLRELDIGLENRLQDKVGMLSGGQRQALSMIMATMAPSKVMLLDEHTAALDPRMSEFVLRLTDKLYKSLDLTIIMVTHSLADALEFGQRTILMHQGKVDLDLSGDRRQSTTVKELQERFVELHAAVA